MIKVTLNKNNFFRLETNDLGIWSLYTLLTDTLGSIIKNSLQGPSKYLSFNASYIHKLSEKTSSFEISIR
jgi:hypothetical protein